MGIRGLFTLLILTAMAVTARAGILNGKIALEVNNGKALLSYRLNGRTVAAAEMQVVNAAMKTVIEEKLPSGSALKIECGDQVTLRAVLRDQGPYLDLEFDSPDSRENVFLMKFKSEVMIVPDTLSDNYIFFRENPKENGGRVFPGFQMVVHLLDGGRAMLSCAWLDADRVFSGRDKTTEQYYNYCLIEFKGKNRLQIGAPAAEGIWGKVAENPEDVEFKKIGWKPPFNAKWLINYSIINMFGKDLFLDESFPVPEFDQKPLSLLPGFSILKPDIWQGYDQVNGSFTYPVYLKDGEVFMRQLIFADKAIQINFDRPQVIYALDAVSKSAGEAMLPLPALKKLLPADKITALQHQRRGRGHGICSGTATIEKIFREEKQKEKREDIAVLLKGMNEYIVFLYCERTKEYRDWETATVHWMAEKNKQNPKLSPACQELGNILVRIPFVWSEKQQVFKTPEYFSATTEKVAALIDSDLDGEKQEDECNKLARQIRTLGGTLHHTLGYCRQVVRAARWTAVQRLLTASDSAEAEFLTAFIEKSSVIIRPHHGEEGK
ncbi:MAG: hypothetical protein KJ964_09605 [Verrucomicrobia bacterium]|nr:hypothetical protein [Verrucomicrobiota bacterium]MBU1735765.1 hypothetical protein [Verrucomicrobiota bacterium]MBU1855579.1 hypothetical protein [Verrucomicrobiota bacterium]